MRILRQRASVAESKPRAGQANDLRTSNPLHAAAPATPLFRAQAHQEHARSHDSEGDIVRVSPVWIGAAFWFLACSLAAIMFILVFARIPEYATGPALVKLANQVDVSTAAPGVVSTVEVRNGDRVLRGQTLARLSSHDEESVVEKLRADLDHELMGLLRDPSDLNARSAVGRARADLDLATSRLEQRLLRAPVDGVVNDVRIRPGLHVTAGDPAISLLGSDKALEVVAMIPGQYGPLLHRGQILTLKITGYSRAQVRVGLDRIGAGVVGPMEVRRILGPAIGDAISISQPVIVVRASLPSATFASDGHVHYFCDGLQGTAEVVVRRQRILFGLLPWTRVVAEKWNV